MHLPGSWPAFQVLPYQVHHDLSHCPHAQDSDFIQFHEDTAADNAKAIIRMAIENFKNRKPELVNIPNLKTKARVGYSVEAIKKELDGVCNSQAC